MEIESKLGRKVYSSDAPEQRRVMTVSDESSESPDEAEQFQRFKEMERFRQQAKQSDDIKNKINPEFKKRIEFLSGIGRIEESVVIDNIKFTLQSLKAKEQEEVFDYISNMGNVNAIKMQFEMRAYTLVKSLFLIDDQPLDLVFGKDPKVQLAALKEFDEAVLDYLYKFYQEKIVKAGQSKYSIKSVAEAKEVVAEIKK